MNYSNKSFKVNIERLAILNAWVTSAVVVLALLTSLITVNVKAFREWKSLTLIVFVSGTVGGAASNYRRLQEAYVQHLSKPNYKPESPTKEVDAIEEKGKIPNEREDAINSEIIGTKFHNTQEIALDNNATLLLLKLQIFLSPLFGGLFAFVLYGIFASGIIQGGLFPKFQSAEAPYNTVYEFAYSTVPATNADASKAIFWAFIAGFAEGFVPNFIDKLVKDTEEEES